ncbi:MAG TPA: hypothetical protein DHM37_04325 [Candidatus Cloacimonas sp.]|jgi:cell division protein FtsL|nr:hypothetical protein [Candidatus Cloacimonadota bacterium]HCX72926.1 hypothetical protein [Candidatus Cloacimonas sp.]
MLKKILLVSVLISGFIFLHYYNKHTILRYARMCEKIEVQQMAQKDINTYLKGENNTLSCRARIQKIAHDRLNMFYPSTTENIHTITTDAEENNFCLIDYIVPKAQALTK